MKVYLGLIGVAITILFTFWLIIVRVKEKMVKMQPQRTQEIKDKIRRLDKEQLYTMLVILFGGCCTILAIVI